eukprot:TRINITY_DN1508_c0_g1_i2.p1 TRINITY_DN1508_c0_g1~~TRINITY_DN1508_c0_g1_i2.p1  ORF type:complete len:113 (-),score=44.51 TRINITY_DN1508_c0_g1_i2:61-399(-)
MKRFCVHKNANFSTSVTIGGSLVVDVWRATLIGGGEVLQVTHTGCIPVHRVVHSPRIDADIESFYDITAGIKDPSIFNRPSVCSPLDAETLLASENAGKVRPAPRNFLGRRD